MKKLLQNLKLRGKIMLMLILPLAGMIYFSTTRVISENSNSNEMESLQQAMLLSRNIGNYVHESQKERGYTAGYLKSKGAKFSSELVNQHKSADVKKAELLSFIEDFNAQSYGTELNMALQKALATLNQIDGTRSSVSSLNIAPGKAISYYTNMHAEFFEVIRSVAKLSTDASLTTQVNAYVSFLLSKERAGLERAVLTGTFAANQFGKGGYEKFIKLVSEQDAYNDVFLSNATTQQKTMFNEKMNSDAVKKVNEMRTVAKEKSITGRFGIDAGAWFSTVTQKINLLKEIEDGVAADVVGLADSIKTKSYASFITSLAIALMVLIVSILISISVASGIIRQMKVLNVAVEQVSAGDLTIAIDDSGRDEFSETLSNLKIMVEKLKEVISKVMESSNNISAAGVEMSDSSQQMSEGATEQASAAEEISSSMEEMVANIQQNTDNAKQTEKIAESASSEIQNGSNAVNETVDSMKTIASKISIIGEISRQTNLLALNAAVEAARAGEHGKGFAVVAAEVRKLAERSQNAAVEIDELSSTSVDVAQKSGVLLKEIVPNIQKTSDLVQEITAASVEQNTGAEQINNAIQQLNEIVQQNAATAEELAASSEELNSQSEYMTDLMGFFRIDEALMKRKATAHSVQRTVTSNGSAPTPQPQSNNLESAGVNINLSTSGGRDSKDSDYEKF